MPTNDIIVIGGGIAGLYASLKCCQDGLSVCTFEKDSRWGGRIRTIKNGTDMYEAGAARFHNNHKHLIHLLKRYNIEMVEIDNRARQYSSRLCSSSSDMISPAYALISEILKKSKTYSASYLRSITFGELAELVLGPTKKEIARLSFGYDGEFDAINAYDGTKMFEKDFDRKEKYYVCKDGIGSLIKNMVDDLENIPSYKWNGHLEHRVVNIKKHKNLFVVTTKRLDGSIYRARAKTLVLALPKEALSQVFPWNKEQLDIIDSVTAVPCERIYARFTDPWYAGSRIVITDLPIRQFIPITDHVAMISYSDSKNANDWNHTASFGKKRLYNRLYKELKELFPDRDIPLNPEWIDAYYWKDAIHMWKPGVNSLRVRKHIQFNLWSDEENNFYVCGEAYSAQQCWINGALDSVEKIMPSIRKRIKIHGGGIEWKEWIKNRTQKKKRLTQSDVKELKKLYPDAKWVLFKDRLIDLTEWYYAHPGGQSPYDNHMHKDVYPFFKNISSHYDTSSGNIKDDVTKKIEGLTIAFIQS